LGNTRGFYWDSNSGILLERIGQSVKKIIGKYLLRDNCNKVAILSTNI
jgi:hypothetical protein